MYNYQLSVLARATRYYYYYYYYYLLLLLLLPLKHLKDREMPKDESRNINDKVLILLEQLKQEAAYALD